jgi:hypothetical protein
LTGDCFHDGGAPGGDPATNLMLGDMGRPGLGRISRNVFFNDAGKDNLTIGSARATPRHVDVSYNTIYGGRFAVTVRGGVHDIQVTRNVLGGASSDVLVRYDMKRSPGTALSQNLAITRATGQPGAGPLLRPKAAARIGGAGNVLSDADPHFTDVHSCRGFETRVPFLAPYGRYGL